jgi:hypothetical protein
VKSKIAFEEKTKLLFYEYPRFSFSEQIHYVSDYNLSKCAKPRSLTHFTDYCYHITENTIGNFSPKFLTCFDPLILDLICHWKTSDIPSLLFKLRSLKKKNEAINQRSLNCIFKKPRKQFLISQKYWVHLELQNSWMKISLWKPMCNSVHKSWSAQLIRSTPKLSLKLLEILNLMH